MAQRIIGFGWPCPTGALQDETGGNIPGPDPPRSQMDRLPGAPGQVEGISNGSAPDRGSTRQCCVIPSDAVNAEPAPQDAVEVYGGRRNSSQDRLGPYWLFEVPDRNLRSQPQVRQLAFPHRLQVASR